MVESDNFQISSNSFKDGALMDKKYTKYGNNVSPHLTWKNAPEGTKSFALFVEDPDAKPICGFTWIHWILKDIPANVTEFNEGKLFGVALENHAKTKDYFGPKPPKGTGCHNYIFILYALKVDKLKATTGEALMKEIQANLLGKTQMVGKYEHKG